MLNNFFEKIKINFKSFNKSTDLLLLVFLILIINVSLTIKLIGVIFIYFMRPDFKFGFKNKRMPFFYLTMIFLMLIQFILNFTSNLNYIILFSLSLSYWMFSILILHQVILSIETQGLIKVKNAITWFFIFNAIVTGYNILCIILEIHSLNPYIYDGHNYKYFASTGDHLRGISFDISTTNNIINSLGIFYFFYQKQFRLSLLCFIITLVTTSNLGNLILLTSFLFIFLFDKSKYHKSIVICFISLMIIFIVKVSPSNLNYLNNKIQSLLHSEKKLLKPHYDDRIEKNDLILGYLKHNSLLKKEIILPKNILYNTVIEKELSNKLNSRKLDSIELKNDEVNRGKFILLFNTLYGDTNISINQNYYEKYPGKYLSFLETFKKIKDSPKHLLIGFGAGNFSSKLAYKATNIGISGKYINKLAYISPDFKEKHLKLTLRYYLKSISEHSMLNFPNSVLNQLIGEYGLIGFLLFIIFYLYYFLKRYKELSYGLMLLPIFLFFLFTDYWFEAFNIVIIFEIMMFIDIYKNKSQLD